jgi:hypothetical protein
MKEFHELRKELWTEGKYVYYAIVLWSKMNPKTGAVYALFT